MIPIALPLYFLYLKYHEHEYHHKGIQNSLLVSQYEDCYPAKLESSEINKDDNGTITYSTNTLSLRGGQKCNK